LTAVWALPKKRGQIIRNNRRNKLWQKKSEFS